MPLPYQKEEGSLAIRSTPTGIMNTHTKITALATTTLLIVGLAGPAKADTPSQTSADNVPTETAQLVAVKAEPTSHLSFERPTVTTTPAPVAVEPVAAPVAVQSAPAEVKPTTPVPAAPVAVQKAPVASQPVPAKPAAPAAPSVPSSGVGAALVASAYSQIGQTQDCTAMVERALGSIGIVTGDLAPAQFFRFGTVVGTPAPGDILITSGHVGIYVGNGMMISGGFNGSQTVLHPVSYIGAYSAVRVG